MEGEGTYALKNIGNGQLGHNKFYFKLSSKFLRKSISQIKKIIAEKCLFNWKKTCSIDYKLIKIYFITIGKRNNKTWIMFVSALNYDEMIKIIIFIKCSK